MSKPKFKIEVVQSAKDPFITVITRCYKRPKFLYLNKASVNNQTYKNYNHYLLIDDTGQGVEAANSFFMHAKNLHLGKYVFLLDDDNAIIYDNFFEDLYNISKSYNPDIIFFKKKQVIEYPTYKAWKKSPVINHIDTSCFCVKRSLYKKYIHEFSKPKRGDYFFINEVFKNLKDKSKVYWLDKITNMAFRISGGKKEDEK
jgi:hypothetical protein